jgi:hypothetical protein
MPLNVRPQPAVRPNLRAIPASTETPLSVDMAEAIDAAVHRAKAANPDVWMQIYEDPLTGNTVIESVPASASLRRGLISTAHSQVFPDLLEE